MKITMSSVERRQKQIKQQQQLQKKKKRERASGTRIHDKAQITLSATLDTDGTKKRKLVHSSECRSMNLKTLMFSIPQYIQERTSHRD